MNGPATVLLVDDDAGMRLTLSRILESHGYRVLAAPSGSAALGLAATERFDLALLDFRMTGMDGAETCGRLSRLCPEAALYVVTAHVTQEAADAALISGAAGILFKPVEVGCVLALIADEVGKRRAGACAGGGV